VSIVMIYHPKERRKVDPIMEGLVARGCDVTMAPLGLEPMSSEWVRRAHDDILAATAAIVFLSNESVLDRSVAVRCEWALQKNIEVYPVVLDDQVIDPNAWVIPITISHYNWLYFRKDHTVALERLLKSLVRSLPKLCFISYSRSDERFVERLEGGLQFPGIDTWRDTKKIPGGASWDNEIEKTIRRYRLVLFVASRRSIESQNVADEIGFARGIGKTIIPILTEDIDLPFRVHRAQAIDFYGSFELGLQKLLRAIENPGNYNVSTIPAQKSGFWTRILRWSIERRR
jgi:hypothetical protein